MNVKHTLLAAAFFASVGTQAQGVVGAAAAEPAPSWTRVKVRIGKKANKPVAQNPELTPADERRSSRCCGNCGTCGVRG